MLMIKTFPGGDGKVGYVKDSIFENFWAYDTTYGLGELEPHLNQILRLTVPRYRSVLARNYHSRHRSRCVEWPYIQQLDWYCR
jgi:hypothetical protein